jgi:hypothetical protein
VIEACALRPDLETFPAGAATEVGERGISLSGGQKARLALARALYAQADVLFLDDVLSALDAHVGAHVWTRAIRGLARARGTTVLLVTHATHLIPEAEGVVVMGASGRVVGAGAPADLAAAGLVDAPARALGGGDRGAEPAAPEADVDAALADTPRPDADPPAPSSDAAKVGSASKAGALVLRAPPAAPPASAPAPAPAPASAGGKLVAAEDRSRGAVSTSTFRSYVDAAGGWPIALGL